MKKIIILLITLILGSAFSFAQGVNKKELQRVTGKDSIDFLSYTGPHKRIDSADAIRNIGAGLGNVVSRTPEDLINTGNSNKYSVLHAVDENQKGKLDADIIYLGENAGVDHIKNLRRIIGTYMESAYGYSREDADALAVFVTVYNAVYRGNLAELQNIYKDVVINNLTKEHCGLSTDYREWPGKTQIIIPLNNVKDGGLSTIDTSIISDSKVVESLKEDDDKNVDSRKQLVDIKERESDNASEKAKESQKEAVEEQKKLDEEKQKTQEVKKEAQELEKKADEAEKKVEEKKQAADDKKKEAEEKKQIAEENPEDEEAQKEAEKAEEEVKKAEEEVKEAEKEADTAKEEADTAKEEVKEQEKKQEEQAEKAETAKDKAKEHQEFADKKKTEAQSERKEIAKDQGIIVKEEIAKAKIVTEYGLVIVDTENMLSRIVKFDISNGEVVKSSPVAVIRNRVMYKAGDSYLAIAGEDTEKGAVKLVLIDEETLEIKAESESTIAPDSVLVQDGDAYYCVVEEDGRYYVAKFGGDLSLKLKSDVAVLPCTPITLTNSGLVVTGVSGTMKILNKSDLKAGVSGTTEDSNADLEIELSAK